MPRCGLERAVPAQTDRRAHRLTRLETEYDRGPCRGRAAQPGWCRRPAPEREHGVLELPKSPVPRRHLTYDRGTPGRTHVVATCSQLMVCTSSHRVRDGACLSIEESEYMNDRRCPRAAACTWQRRSEYRPAGSFCTITASTYAIGRIEGGVCPSPVADRERPHHHDVDEHVAAMSFRHGHQYGDRHLTGGTGSRSAPCGNGRLFRRHRLALMVPTACRPSPQRARREVAAIGRPTGPARRSVARCRACGHGGRGQPEHRIGTGRAPRRHSSDVHEVGRDAAREPAFIRRSADDRDSRRERWRGLVP